MKVKELIEKLQKVNQDYPVIHAAELIDCGFESAYGIDEIYSNGEYSPSISECFHEENFNIKDLKLEEFEDSFNAIKHGSFPCIVLYGDSKLTAEDDPRFSGSPEKPYVILETLWPETSGNPILVVQYCDGEIDSIMVKALPHKV